MSKKVEHEVRRIDGYLQRVITIKDGSGKILHTVMRPFMVELMPRDILQIIVGASVLAIPIGLTEEAWTLGSELSMAKVLILSGISLSFLALFIYFNFYRFHLKGNVFDFLKRVVTTYLLSLLVVGVLLTVIEKCPWATDSLLAIKRILIAGLPASMAATLTDTMK